MRNKIILIDSQNEKEPYLEASLGLLSLGTFLKKNGYEVIIIKMDKDNPEKIEKYIDKNTLFAGFGVKTNQVEAALIISEYIKRIDKDMRIVWGGVHVNLFPKQVIENKNIDIIVFGDGEYTLLDIAKALQKNKSLKNIPGCAYKTNEIVFNKRRGFTDISKLPKTDYSILDEIEKYIEDSRFSAVTVLRKNITSFPILSGVGCPFNCSFCYNTTQRERISKRNVDTMLDEIEYLQKKYDIALFNLHDELFFYDKKRVEEFIRKKKKRKLKFLWASSFHINLLKNEDVYSDEFLKELKNEGLAYNGLGVESGSINQLKRYRKNITPEDVIKVVKRFENLKMVLTYSFMIGAPCEKYEDMVETVGLIYKLRFLSPKYAYVTGPVLFRPYPGADIYQDAIKLGYKEKKSLEEWKGLHKISGYNSYKDTYYLKNNLKKIYNIFYYLKIIKALSQIDNKCLHNFFIKNNRFMANKSMINFVGLVFRNFAENSFVDKYISRKIIGRSLILEK